MSLESVYDDRIEAAFQRDFRAPPRPVAPSFDAWATLAAGAELGPTFIPGTNIPRAVFTGPASGLSEIGASVSEFLSGAQQETFRRGRLPVQQFQPDDSLRRSEDLKAILNAGPALRQTADYFAQPEAAHTADQVLHGFTRIASKGAVASLLPGGPLVAGAALGLEEANTRYRELVDKKGVDPNTAAKVAAVEGAGAGLGLAMPLAGPGIKSTIALGLAGGPGTYVAQEIAAKKILERAGYHDEASLHNPADPLGLTVATLFPFAVGGAHIAGLRGKKAELAEVVQHLESRGQRNGKDGQILEGPPTKYGTAKGEMQVLDSTALNPGHGIAPAKTLPDGTIDAADRARVGRELVDALEQKYGGDEARAMAAYNWGEGNVDKAIAKHGDEWLQHAPDETRAYVAKGMNKLRQNMARNAAADPEVVDAARVRVTEDALNRNLPNHPEARAELMYAHDEIAAGRMPDVESFTTVYHGSPHSFDKFDMSKIGTGEGAQAYGHGLYFADNPTVAQSYKQGSIDFAPVAPPSIAEDLNQTLQDMIRQHRGGATTYPPTARDAAEKVLRDYQAKQQVALKSGNFDAYSAASDRALDAQRALQTLPKEEGGAFYKVDLPDSAIARMLDWDKPLSQQSPEVQKAVQTINPKNRTGQSMVALDPTGEELARTLAGNSNDLLRDAGIPGIKYLDQGSRGAGEGTYNYVVFDDALPRIRERNGVPVKSEGTNAVPPPERVTIEPAAPAAKAEAVQSPAAQAATKLADEQPDLLVKLPGSDENLTVATALERAKAQAVEEAKEANWVKAALDCALSGFRA